MDIEHIGLPRTFLGMDNNLQKAKYVVLSCPYDSTCSYRTGTRHGPEAIMQASHQVETWNTDLKADFSEAGIYTADELEVNRGSAEKNCEYVKQAVKAVLSEGKIPVLLGGEHSVSIGAFEAFAEKDKEISVLHIDAHADMRKEYDGTKYSHACVMGRCREKLHAVSVGVRSFSEEEGQEIKEKVLDVFGIDFDEAKVIEKLKKKVYITIDLDAFDPSVVPGVGTPEPGGLQWQQVLGLLKQVSSKRQVVGFDVVELCPIPGSILSDFAAAKLVYKLISYIEANKK